MTAQARTTYRGKFQRVTTVDLPIYLARGDKYVTAYVPRFASVLDSLTASAVLEEVGRLAVGPSRTEDQSGAPLIRLAAARILRGAENAMRETAAASPPEFMPECLTLFVNNRCNLRCRYCYSQPQFGDDKVISREAVRAASRLVAAACAAQDLPFTVAFHGGGEPSLDRHHVDRLLDTVREEAQRLSLELRTYIATNGAVSERTAHWLARRFDLVGVSCDGPPAIQDCYRPGRTGRRLSPLVDRTMRILEEGGRPFQVRVTISAETVCRLGEVVSYLMERYRPDEIRLEPVYANPSGEDAPRVSYASAFVDGFVAAKKAGQERAIRLTTSITRLDALYGPYCNALRHTINLVPGDVATGCFLESRPDGVDRRGVKMGSFNPVHGSFTMDADNIARHISRCSGLPADCLDCMCSSQCTFGCPDHCVLGTTEQYPTRPAGRGSLRCLINRMLTESTVAEAAREAWDSCPQGDCRETYDAERMVTVAVYRVVEEGL